ncbi:MFS transporter [Nitrospirillum sp. BR 11164]|uniref:MFS transporter n=1 Tax=Nitrospirillum sp. BR 11164 TaxID=3104324 RepID=UPI002AFFAED9|nr:MFS transporter [Nitrospirillum sp. BR 11164]MEA1653191.1 MFS transporter [Nitrospirillum sp. BR 11164]
MTASSETTPDRTASGQTASGQTASGGLPAGLTLLFAVTCGAVVANIYYVQPLLADIAASFQVGMGSAGMLVTVTQVGYALGLLLVVPLGDTHNRKRLILTLLALCIALLLAAAASPGFLAFAAASLGVGVLSCAAQVAVPFAASLAPDHSRGRTVGTVMSGLILGILLARTIAGAIAHYAGWRAVYLAAAVVMTVLGALLARALPADPARPSIPYGRLMASVLHLARTDAVLRWRSLMGALGFAGFSVLWTGLTFVLSDAPYHFDQATIGLFGLAGLAGALAASRAGRLADKGHAHAATGLFAAACLAAWGLMALTHWSLIALTAGIVLLDIGVQGLQITNQSVIYAGNHGARGRVTTVYLTTYFVGGACGSAVASLAWDLGGWPAVSATGGAVALALLGCWLLAHARREEV